MRSGLPIPDRLRWGRFPKRDKLSSRLGKRSHGIYCAMVNTDSLVTPARSMPDMTLATTP